MASAALTLLVLSEEDQRRRCDALTHRDRRLEEGGPGERAADRMSAAYFVNVPDGVLFVDPYGPMLMTIP